ncbi:MAG: response regulator [Paracoccaceae bacterium]|nr:response regulator [Rhodobacterales bacterium HTCC2150] [Rhodobacteraceae bacterium HTCC2150]MDG1531904.1 response regulator [Paracoccaceae bacterium]
MGHHVLLIEDEPNITEALRFLLNRDGFTVATHADGATALEAIDREAPDLIVLDVMLPNKNGFDILRDLRAETATQQLPVLMLTAKGQEKDRALAESFKVDKFMTKPFSNQEIVSTINDLLAR